MLYLSFPLALGLAALRRALVVRLGLVTVIVIIVIVLVILIVILPHASAQLLVPGDKLREGAGWRLAMAPASCCSSPVSTVIVLSVELFALFSLPFRTPRATALHFAHPSHAQGPPSPAAPAK